MREARARFGELLAEARAGNPQVIRSTGEEDVSVARADQDNRGPRDLPLSYLLASLAERDGVDIAIEQWQERELGARAPRTMGDMHIPANLSGDVAHWIRRSQGAFALAMHVVDTAIALRKAQDMFGLPLSSVSAVASGLDLTARGALIDADTVREIAAIVRNTHWGIPDEAAEAVLGDDWHQIARRGDVPDDL